MRTRWGVAAIVGLAGWALVACSQPGTVEVAKDETRSTSLEMSKMAPGAPLRVEATDLKVLETVEKASGKVISAPHLKGTLKLENVGTAETIRLLRGEVAYLGADGKVIPVGKDEEKPALKFGYGSSESLDPGQKSDQTLDLAYPAGAVAAKSVKDIRVLVTYVSSPHKTQNFDIPVKIQ